jgi:GMP synthase (glutamine-hydrolysing)
MLVIIQTETGTAGRLGDKLEARGYSLDVRCPLVGDPLPPSMDDHAGAVILGGPMSANDDGALPGLRAELDWIPIALTSCRPLLGICLGAQLLARTLGARVAPHPHGLVEIGYSEIHPTAAGGQLFPEPLHVYHWHREGFELPADTVLLAAGERFPNQAFRYDATAFGIQFHPEVTHAMMEQWMVRAADRLTLPGAQQPNQQRNGHNRHDKSFESWLDRFLDCWLDGS